MGECRQPRGMQCRDQQAGRNAGRLVRVIPLFARTLRIDGIAFVEDRDEPWRRFEEWLVGIRAERRQCPEPFIRCAARIELALLGFGGLADAALGRGIGDRDESPGLLVGAARCTCRGTQALFDDRAWHGRVRERAHRPAALE